jgi:chaperonin cofactor prefoldin
MREMMEKRPKAAREDLDKRIETILDRMNVPTKADIEALGDKISMLSSKVDTLRRAEERQAEKLEDLRKINEREDRKLNELRKATEEEPVTPARKTAEKKA